MIWFCESFLTGAASYSQTLNTMDADRPPAVDPCSQTHQIGFGLGFVFLFFFFYRQKCRVCTFCQREKENSNGCVAHKAKPNAYNLTAPSSQSVEQLEGQRRIQMQRREDGGLNMLTRGDSKSDLSICESQP